MAEYNFSALSRLFSVAVIRDLAESKRSLLFTRLLEQSGIVGELQDSQTISDLYQLAFSKLAQQGTRNDYYFRNSIVQKLLLGRHSLNTASMLFEFRAGLSRADLVLLNGTATAYEIKSDRDSISRLDSQLQDYMQVFAAVTVVASEKHLNHVLAKAPRHVGVSTITPRGNIHVERDAVVDASRVRQAAILDSITIDEAGEILRVFGMRPPSVPNTLRRTAYLHCFKKIEPTELHQVMVDTLKNSRDHLGLSNLIPKIPTSLYASAISFKWSKRYTQNSFLCGLHTPVEEALQWK